MSTTSPPIIISYIMNYSNKLLLALSASIAITACTTSHETPQTVSDIVVRVSTAGLDPQGRAVPAQIPGYQLKFVMQLFADDGVAVGSRQVIAANEGQADFLLQAKDINNGATKAAFWAEYMSTEPLIRPNIYNSDDLSNIRYNSVEFDMTDANRMAATEAFAGVLTTLTNGASITLTRPMIKLNFSPNNPELAEGAKAITVSYNAPSSYNILDATCPQGAYTPVVYTNSSFTPEQTPWFTNMIFAPSNMAKLDQPVTLKLSGRVDQTMTIVKNTIPLDANYIVNATANITRAETQDLEVEVTIDDEFINDPDRNVEMVLGSYINSKGRATLDKNSAVGIVFYMGAMSGDNIGLYPADYAGKTIKAYAVAIENVSKARAQFNEEMVPAGWPQNDKLINGMQNSDFILSQLGESAFYTAWTEWTTAHALKSEGNTTPWYLPARPQMEEWMSLLMETTSTNNVVVPGSPTGSAQLRALFPLNTIFDRNPFQNCMYATCSVNSNGNIQGTSLTATENGTNGTVKFSQIDVKTKTQSVLGRPMITIFEEQ